MSSLLFNLPIEILERILHFLSPHLSAFALTNSDCRYLARPLQYRCINIELSDDDTNTPHRRHHDAMASLLGDYQRLMAAASFEIAPYIRYLHLQQGNLSCGKVPQDDEVYEVFSVRNDLLSLFPALVNLEAFSHGIADGHILCPTAAYMLALIRSPAKHVVLDSVLFLPVQVALLESEGVMSWNLERLTILSHRNVRNLPNAVPSLLINLCSKSLERLTLDCGNAFDIFSRERIVLPALRTLHLDPKLGNNLALRYELCRQPALIALRTPLMCAIKFMPTLRRYASNIASNDDLEQVLDNLHRNPQLESLSITFEKNFCLNRAFPIVLMNAFRRLRNLRALRLDGESTGHLSIQGMSLIATMSTLRNLQLLIRVNLRSLRKCLRSSSMRRLEWLSVELFFWTDSFRHIWTRFPDHVVERIRLYDILNEAELFAAVLPSLRACIIGSAPIEITNGKAQALLVSPCEDYELDELLDHNLSIVDTHLWRWD